jgi:transcriptional repressor NrdR
MNCPYCEHGETKVIDTRVAGKGTIRRRRECLLCSQRMTTFERVEQAPLHVVKRDGSRQPFDRTKLMAGLTRACVKRPVPLAQIEQAAVRIEADLRNGVGDEVEARKIGEQALRVLRDLDRVAYVRFASVYRDFQDVDEFERELALLEGRKKPARRVAKRTSVR